MDKVSIYTIAQRVGVSGVTVSRALSGKDNVRPETRQRILEVAQELNYRPNRLASRLSSSNITIVMFCIGTLLKEFNLDLFRGAFDAGLELSDYHIRVRLCSLQNLEYRATEATVEKVIEILESGVQGIINTPTFSSLEANMRIRDVIRKNDIAEAHVLGSGTGQNPIFTYCSDTCTAGALAAELLWNMLGDGGKVSIFTGQRDKHLHADSIRGFKTAMERYPLDLVSIYENYDDPELAYHTTEALLRNHPDVRGIYVGSANSLRVCQCISESDRANDILMITSDMYSDLLPYIDQRLIRATIVQDQYTQSYEAFHALANYLMTGAVPELSKRIIRPEIVMSGNARQYLTNESDQNNADCLAAIEYYDV